jgi:peptidoglycan/xylan/chitin deacetylase (PgdA/CDA1 family)
MARSAAQDQPTPFHESSNIIVAGFLKPRSARSKSAAGEAHPKAPVSSEKPFLPQGTRQKDHVQFRPTYLLWYIVLAPFLTLEFLVGGYLQSLWILGFSHVALILTTLWPSLEGFGQVDTTFRTEAEEVWLTIDDGPNPATTLSILDLLAEFDAKATFFLVGDNVLRWPALAARIVAGGHTLGNHTKTHPQLWFWALGPRRLRLEIDGFEAIARQIRLPIPILFRAPVGMKNPFVHPILSARSLRLVGWSVRGFDTGNVRAQQIFSRLENGLRPGAIILLHERSAASVEALRMVLSCLRERGLRCVVPAYSAFADT